MSPSPRLTWRVLDPLERALMALCGLTLFGFSATVLLDILTRLAGHPLRSAQEITNTFFIYGIFTGAAVATRRNEHLTLTAAADALRGTPRLLLEMIIRSVILTVALCMVVFGYRNFLGGFTSFRMPSMTPIASLYAAIPLSGALIALFALEGMVQGCRNGFEAASPHTQPAAAA